MAQKKKKQLWAFDDLYVGQKGNKFRVHFIVILSHHFAIIVTPTLKGCNPASRDYLPQFVESLGAQEKFESAQCSVSMKEWVFLGENSYSFLLFL